MSQGCVEKDAKIWTEIKRRAQEVVKFGEMNASFKVQDGKIVLAEILQERIKIG